MKSKKDFFNDGFIFGKLDEYKDLFDYNMMLNLKEVVNSENIYQGSRHIYEYHFDGRKINKLLKYNDVQANIGKDTDPENKLSDETTEKLYKQTHLMNVCVIDNSDAWILGEVNDSIYGDYRDDVKEQQTKFTNHYYEKYKDSRTEDFSLGNTLVQFYDEGCRIGAHNDGSPSNRVATFLYFLNDEWDTDNGGQLVINPNTDNEIMVEPTFPNFVVLDQSEGCKDNIHEVKEVNSDVKLTLTSFFETHE